jgi:hypothetical protein
MRFFGKYHLYRCDSADIFAFGRGVYPISAMKLKLKIIKGKDKNASFGYDRIFILAVALLSLFGTAMVGSAGYAYASFRYDDGAFWLPLSQKDTFALSGWLRYQVRVLFPDGSVKASAICGGIVSDSISKEVLA